MNQNLHEELKSRSKEEPYAGLLGLEAVEVGDGRATVRMTNRPELRNIFSTTHGGAIFSLIDEAFQLACNSHGVLSVALNVSITYVAAATDGAILEARVQETHRTNRTASYQCEVREIEAERLVATAQALAYRTGKQIS
ncbi:MAG: PaaI family thioesterase [Pseudomonadota bacterium]